MDVMEHTGQINANQSSNDEEFQSLVVIEFSRKISQPSVEWILKKITGPKLNGGMELWACTVLDQNLGVNYRNNYTILYMLTCMVEREKIAKWSGSNACIRYICM